MKISVLILLFFSLFSFKVDHQLHAMYYKATQNNNDYLIMVFPPEDGSDSAIGKMIITVKQPGKNTKQDYHVNFYGKEDVNGWMFYLVDCDFPCDMLFNYSSWIFKIERATSFRTLVCNNMNIVFTFSAKDLRDGH